jgi:hypothetical protein
VTINWPETLRARFAPGKEGWADVFAQKTQTIATAQPKSDRWRSGNMITLWSKAAAWVYFPFWQRFSGQTRNGPAEMDWDVSNSHPHFWQEYS